MNAEALTSTSDEPQLPKRRLILGVGVYVVGQLAPLCIIPLLGLLNISDSLKGSLSALVFFGVPPVFSFAAVGILGKDGFNYLKRRLFAFLRRRLPTGPVSRTRYYIGLVLFMIPLLFAWLSPYVTPVLPALEQHRFSFAVAGDVILVVSLLVLGGDFWEKLRGLLIHRPAAVAA